jgi:ssDNA-binding Zn-finger/Zn-ribbon topoisomerase 1
MIEYARWATKEERTNFWANIRKKSATKEELTYQWLVVNGDRFIELHSTFQDDWFEFKHKEHRHRFIKAAREYESMLGQRCVCKGDMRKVTMPTYEFIGCENYREQGFEHVRKYKPNYVPYSENEISTMYLYNLKQLHDLPKELKESILYEYLLMRNIETHADLSKKYQIAKDCSSRSNKREVINKNILSTIFDKLYHNKIILVKFSNNIEEFMRPDFIAIKGNKCILFEQKKNKNLIDETQVLRYLDAIKWMINNSLNKYSVEYFYIIEEGEPNFDKRILTLDTLLTYEFN